MLNNAKITAIIESIALFAPIDAIATKYQAACELARLKSELTLQGCAEKYDQAARIIAARLQGEYGININLD